MVKPTNPPHPAVLHDVNAYKIPFPLVEVVWNDASSNSESWVSIKDIQPPEQVITVGWLVLDVPGVHGYVSIASSLSNEELHEEVVGNTMTIPRGMIVRQRIVAMREVKPKVVKPKGFAAAPPASPVRFAE